jgi:hypothetical protein
METILPEKSKYVDFVLFEKDILAKFKQYEQILLIVRPFGLKIARKVEINYS